MKSIFAAISEAEWTCDSLGNRALVIGERTLAACWSPHSAATNFSEHETAFLRARHCSSDLQNSKAECRDQHAECVRSPDSRNHAPGNHLTVHSKLIRRRARRDPGRDRSNCLLRG